MNNKVVQYSSVFREPDVIYNTNYNTVKFSWRKGGYGWSIPYSNGKDAYLREKGKYRTPSDDIRREACWDPSANRNFKVFISSSSKLSRDLVRNSGYQIVRDKTRADYIIIPKVRDDIASYQFNLGFQTDDNMLYFVKVRKSDSTNMWTEEEVGFVQQKITEIVTETIVRFYYNTDLSDFDVFFMPKCEEYRDIYEGRTTGNFALDSNIELVGSTSISLETLDIWKRMETQGLLEKAILNSDWQKYPCTVAVFLVAEKSGYCRLPTGQWKWLLDQIDFDMFERAGTFGDKNISPEDWNMLQKWILYLLGLEEKGGFVSMRDANNLNYAYGNLLRSRMCYAPMFVSEPSTFKNLVADVKNS